MSDADPHGEGARLAVLHDLHLSQATQAEEFEALARLAAYICGTPTAAVNLIDSDTEWQIGSYGFAPGRVPREDTMCTHAIATTEVTYTPDASLDAVFSSNPYVDGTYDSIRLWVAAPLVVSDQVVGTLCAFASRTMHLDRQQIERLQDVAFTAAQFLRLRRTTNELAGAALRDPLTGLHNRAVFEDALERAFARRHRALTRPGILFIDLDHFKPINDTYGHATGDVVLEELADRLLSCARGTDLVARLGGDEFVVLIEEKPHLEDSLAGAVVITERIRRAIAAPWHVAGQVLHLRASVGWAVADDEDETPHTLLERADAAMYADKASAKATPTAS